jgi:hypothetical protein
VGAGVDEEDLEALHSVLKQSMQLQFGSVDIVRPSSSKRARKRKRADEDDAREEAMPGKYED